MLLHHPEVSMQADKHFRMFSGSQLQNDSFPVRVLGASDGNQHVAIPFVLPVAVPNTAGSIDIVMDRKVRVLRVDVLKLGANGGSGDTLLLEDGDGNNITNDIDLNINQKAVTKNSQIDPAYATLDAGDTLRLTAAKATNCACQADVTLLPVV